MEPLLFFAIDLWHYRRSLTMTMVEQETIVETIVKLVLLAAADPSLAVADVVIVVADSPRLLLNQPCSCIYLLNKAIKHED